MRIKQLPPLENMGRVIDEIDLSQDSTTGPEATAFTAFKFTPEIALKDIHIPVLTPLVDEDVPGSPPEPVFDAAAQDDIQGNIIPGFNKDHQHFLFLRIRNPKHAKVFLREILPRISTMEEVMAFRRLYRSKRFLLGRHNTYLCSTWINIAFSRRAIELLANKADADAFGDGSFQLGLAKRSSYLGDPTASKHPGSPPKWKVGGPKNEADIVLILAWDHTGVLDDLVELLKLRAHAHALDVLFEQRGDTLSGDLRGHEHFGFKDGISQPGVRGKLSSSPGDYITPRYIAASDPRRIYMAKPGQQLVWPGQFLLGEQRQSTEDQVNAIAAASNFPKWARRGSYLVVRRLQQDVPAFYTFVARGAARAGIARDKFAAMLVGRWPSGAPILRVPGGDNPALGDDDFANNHFIFNDDTRPSSLRPIPGYPGDAYPQAVADFLAQVCPHFAHIRKVHPRESATEMGKPADSFTRMILRRGIPYGPQLVGIKKPKPALIGQDRGLMFLCYDVLRVARYRSPRWQLADAQHAVAHGYGFDSWPALKLHVETARQQRSAASSSQKAEGASAVNTGGAPNTAIQAIHSDSSHPLAGTWAKRASASSANRSDSPMDDMVVEFELTDGTVTLTQIVIDSTGRHSAMKTVIQADGQDHSAEFGEGLVLQATWTNERTLELIFKRAETTVSEWAYSVSADGSSLMVSTTEHVVVFERIE